MNKAIILLLAFSLIQTNLFSQFPRDILERGVSIAYFLTEENVDNHTNENSKNRAFLREQGFKYFDSYENDLAKTHLYAKDTDFGPLGIGLELLKTEPNVNRVSFRLGTSETNIQNTLNESFYNFFEQLAALGYGQVISKEKLVFYVEHSTKKQGFLSPKERALKKYPNDPVKSKYAIFIPIEISSSISFGPAIIADDEIDFQYYIYWLMNRLSN